MSASRVTGPFCAASQNGPCDVDMDMKMLVASARALAHAVVARYRPRLDDPTEIVPVVLVLALSLPVSLLVGVPTLGVGVGLVLGAIVGGAIAVETYRVAAHQTRRKLAEADAEADRRVVLVTRQYEWAVNDVANLRDALRRSQTALAATEAREHARRDRIDELERVIAGKPERSAANGSVVYMRSRVYEQRGLTWLRAAASTSPRPKTSRRTSPQRPCTCTARRLTRDAPRDRRRRRRALLRVARRGDAARVPGARPHTVALPAGAGVLAAVPRAGVRPPRHRPLAEPGGRMHRGGSCEGPRRLPRRARHRARDRRWKLARRRRHRAVRARPPGPRARARHRSYGPLPRRRRARLGRGAGRRRACGPAGHRAPARRRRRDRGTADHRSGVRGVRARPYGAHDRHGPGAHARGHRARDRRASRSRPAPAQERAREDRRPDARDRRRARAALHDRRRPRVGLVDPGGRIPRPSGGASRRPPRGRARVERGGAGVPRSPRAGCRIEGMTVATRVVRAPRGTALHCLG